MNGRLYTVNNQYFSSPNIENCYWAGFIAADGCIKSNDNHTLAITLQKSDHGHLEKFKTAIDFTGPVKDASIYICCAGNSFKEDLQKHFNITEKKSLTLFPPNLENEDNIRAFIRGYFDGDGTLNQRLDSKHFRFIFLGTNQVVNWIKLVIDKYVDVLKPSIQQKENLFVLEYSGYQSQNIGEWLYRQSDESSRLERKYKKFQCLLDFYSDKTLHQPESNFPGVSWHKKLNKWTVNISINNITKYIGSFDSEVDAYHAYLEVKHGKRVGESLHDFHTAFDCSIGTTNFSEPDLVELRKKLIREEYEEVLKAIENCDKENLLKELCDLVYVTVGTATAFGLDFDEAFRRVHQSNMSKLGEDGKPIYREDGKVLKGSNYKPVNLKDLIDKEKGFGSSDE